MGTSLSFKTKKSPTIRPIKTTSQPPDAQLINWTQTKMYHKIFMFLFFAGKKPVVKSVDMTLVNNSDKVKLVCRIKDFSRETEIYWKKDGQPVIEIQGKIKIRSRR